MLTYQQTIDFLFNQLPMYQRIGQAAYKGDLNNTIALDTHCNHPHRLYKTIHVAGTNGKGSVSHLLASILAEKGYKTGLYTSPHLKDFRERIKINGINISENDVTHFVHNHRSVIEEIKPSFFEMTVAMAFDHFARHKVEVAVIEVGLGGRLDSTNIITPELSVITNIGLDHTAILGNTLSAIAHEKAGIIKPNIPVVIGETHPETKAVFTDKAIKNNSSILWADQFYNIDYSTQTADFQQVFQVYHHHKLVFPQLQTPLLGIYQRKNAQTVLATINILNHKGFNISPQNIYDGFKNVVDNTQLLGRWQILGTNPLTICDTGHNEAGMREVVDQLNRTPFKKLHFIIGMVSDKDINGVLQLLPTNAQYYFTKANIPRALNENELQNIAKNHGLTGNTYVSVSEAMMNAKKNAEVNDLIFIGGSTFIVADAI